MGHWRPGQKKKVPKKRKGPHAKPPMHLVAYQKRDDIAHELNFPSYQAYLKSELWLRIKENALDHHGRQCVGCGSTANLQIHHRDYHYETMVGHRMASLAVVCKSCHSKIEGVAYGRKVSLTEANARLNRKITARNQAGRKDKPPNQKSPFHHKDGTRKGWFERIVAEIDAAEHAIVGNRAAGDTGPSASARPFSDLTTESPSRESVVTAPGSRRSPYGVESATESDVGCESQVYIAGPKTKPVVGTQVR